uniref:Xylulose kinase-1 n=1 Tax=Tanacetum cinerariifolium TaxID=118510 RepID=A0A6L2J784_TANCI|nr:hypothetical protein [Tanacetum cinerariifolium]
MIAFLTKSDVSEGFDQIFDFLNAHMIQHVLMVNPTIYVLCIKQFWTFISIKKSNDVVRLQALIDRKKVIIIEDTIRQALRLDDADGIDCLPNEEIFSKLARMGYEKPSTNLTFFKAFFSAQWNMVRNVDSPSKFLMYPRFLQLMINAQVDDLSSHNTKYTSPALTQKVFTNMRRIGGCIQTKGKIAKLDADGDVTLVDAKEDVNADVQGKLAESQAKVYHLDLQHAEKVLSMQDTDEAEPAKVKEVIKVVTATKLMTEVVTTATTTITAAQVPKASAPRRRRGVVIQDPEETATTSVIVHTEDEAFARQLEAELNANINWDDVMEQVKRREKQDNTVMRYQALKRKPMTEAQARNNMMIYLKNMAGFKMDFFKANDDDDVYTEATPLELKVSVVDYQIHYEHNKPYYKIIKADETHQLFLSFITLLKNFDIEDLEMLWKLRSKGQIWIRKSQDLEAIRILWSSHHNIHNYSDDSASGKEIAFDALHSGTNVEQSDKVIKSSVENLVPIRSEFEVTFDNEIECDVLVCDDFTTFSNLLFDSDNYFSSSDDESLSNEDVPMENFKIYLNPLFDNEEIISTKIDLHYFNAESNLIESLLNQDTLIDSSPKFDYLLELAHIDPIPPGIKEVDFDLEEKIRLVKNLLYDNSFPRPPKEINVEIADTIVESLSPYPIPIEDSDSQMEEIDLFLDTDDLMPPGIENDDYDLEGDINFLKELLSNDPFSLLENESSNFDHHDDLSFPRPPLEPPNVEVLFDFEPDSGELISAVMNDIDELNEDECFDLGGGEIDFFSNVKDDDYFSFIFVIRIFLPYLTYPEFSPLLLSTGSEDTIFDPDIST